MKQNRNDDNNRQYLAVFSVKILRRLALVSLVVTAILLGLALWQPSYFEVDIARFILCTAVATSLSIFFFVFYPQSIEMNIGPAIGIPLRIVGPIVLWFGVLLFLWQWMPSATYGRVFRPVKSGQPGGMYYGGERSTKIWIPNGPEVKYHLIPNKNDRGLFGIYVEFDRNVRSFKAKLKHEPYEPIDVLFSRTGPDTFETSFSEEGETR